MDIYYNVVSVSDDCCGAVNLGAYKSAQEAVNSAEFAFHVRGGFADEKKLHSMRSSATWVDWEKRLVIFVRASK